MAHYMLALAAGCYLYYALTGQGTWFPLRDDSPQAPHDKNFEFSWEAVGSKPYLDYTPCYGEFQCARLQLPMDYWNGTTNDTVSIAVIKKPALVPVTHPQYGGAVLHNPGGPGGSGVGFLLGAGWAMQAIIGSPDGLQFDHISFDPRGILFSRPLVECFKNPDYEQFWTGRVIEEGVYSSSDAAFGRLWSMAVAQAGSCSLPPENGTDIKQYVNTAFVSRDMLEIVERHGEWREAEAKRLLQKEGVTAVLDVLKYRPGEEKINYWGFCENAPFWKNSFMLLTPLYSIRKLPRQHFRCHVSGPNQQTSR